MLRYSQLFLASGGRSAIYWGDCCGAERSQVLLNKPDNGTTAFDAWSHVDIAIDVLSRCLEAPAKARLTSPSASLSVVGAFRLFLKGEGGTLRCRRI